MRYHNYIFLDSKRSVSSLLSSEWKQAKKEFATVLQKSSDIRFFSYMTLGLKTNAKIMLWLQADQPYHFPTILGKLLQTRLGQHVTISYTLFGMVGKSTYVKRQSLQEQAIGSGKRSVFLIIYPFTKTQDWYMLDFEKRKSLMGEHMRVGHAHPRIRQLLLYSFGIDNQEFIVSYETDDLSDFQKLVIEMRGTVVRKYTLSDTPIFTCIHRPVDDVLDLL